MSKPRLTIGMTTFDDYDGVYFTLQSLSLYHKEIIDECEIIVIDNNPTSAHGKEVEKTCKDFGKLPGTDVDRVKYVTYTEKQSTSVRNELFKLASSDFVLCMDCHVMLNPGAIVKLVEFFEATNSDDLIHGPLVHEDGETMAVGMNDIWGIHFWGQWIYVNKKDLPYRPFEIRSHGFGLFACKKNAWLGFNKHYQGFGGEEKCYHELVRAFGRRVICLPQLQWYHRFTRVSGNTPYPNHWEDRFRNYVIGFMQVGMDLNILKEEFKDLFTIEHMNNVVKECIHLDTTPVDVKVKYKDGI